MSKILSVVQWVESEAGMGTRPDGYSLHLNDTVARQYVDRIISQRPAGGPTPHEYVRPSGESVLMEATEDLYNEVVGAGGTVRAWDIVCDQSRSGARRVARRQPLTTETFIDQVLLGKAQLADIDIFVEKWHDGAAPGVQLHTYLGMTWSEYVLWVKNPGYLETFVFQRVVGQLKPQIFVHKKSGGTYLALGDGKAEADLSPVTVYLGVDGQIWVRDERQFKDGRFKPAQTPSVGLNMHVGHKA